MPRSRKSDSETVPALAEWPQSSGGKDAKFAPAGEVEPILRKLLDVHDHLTNAVFRYIFVKKPFTSEGDTQIVRLIQAPPLWHYLDGADFVLKIAHDAWKALGPMEREALIDEQLCRVMADTDAGTFSFTGPDFKGYIGNIRRYGLWNRGAQALKGELLQMKLDFGPTTDAAGEVAAPAVH